MRIRHLVMLVALLAPAVSCGSNGGDYCDAYCDCVDCSEKERDICLAGYDAEEDIAGVYECDAEHSDWVDCVIAKADCPGGEFNADECSAIREEYERCKH